MPVAPHASWLSTRGYLRRRPFYVVLAAVVLATCLLSFMQFRLYDAMRMGLRDLGFTLQSFESLIRERPYLVRLGYAPNTANSAVLHAGWDVRSVFSEHIYLTMSEGLPLYLLFRSPYPLFVLQAAFVASAAIPLFLLARRRLRHEWLAAAIAVAYLLHPGVQIAALGTYVYGPRADNATPLFLFGMLYFADARRPRAFWLMALLGLASSETFAPVVAAIGAYTVLMRRSWWRQGIGVALTSGLYFLLCALVIIPWASAAESRSPFYFSALQAVPVLWRHPEMLVPIKDDVVNLAGGIGLPLAFLAFLAPAAWLIAVPDLVTGLLARLVGYTLPIELGTWHGWSYIVAAFTGLISVLAFLRTRGRARLTCAAVFLLAPAMAAGIVLYGPYPFSRNVYPAAYDVDAVKFAAVKRAQADVPHNASLSVEFFLGSHFAERPNVYWFPVNWRNADYVLVDAGAWAWWSDDDARALARVQHSGSMELQWQAGRIFLFRHVPDLPIETPVAVPFVNGLELIGYSVSPAAIHSGDPITLTLFWRAPAGQLAHLPDLTVFNHLVGPDGHSIAQRDNPPDNGTYPFPEWTAGEMVVDRYTLRMPGNAITGQYAFESGLYDAATGKRLITSSGEDMVRLPVAVVGN